MLAGCSSTLLSPRHRLRSEASEQFSAACHHYPIPSMSTQRLDLPCTFPRKDVPRSQSVRPVGISVEKSMETKSLKQSKDLIKPPPPPFWVEKGKSAKRRSNFDDEDDERLCLERRVKRKRASIDFGEGDDDISSKNCDPLSFWVQPGFGQVPFSLTCSGEEERVCFVPTDVIPPSLPPLSHNPWVESSGGEATDYGGGGGGDQEGETSHGPVRETTTTSGSSSSSDSQTLGLRLHESNPDVHEFGRGLMFTSTNGDGSHNDGQLERQGFELVSYLMGCVEAISFRNIAAIHHFIAKLGDQASPRGRSSITRLSAYFTEALALRVTRIWPHIFHISIPRELDRFDDESGAVALRLLNEISPIPKFIHFTANEMLLRAFDGKDKVHIIDFDIKQGLQWPGFFQSLASRGTPPSKVRITGIGESKQDLIDTGERLFGFAEVFNLDFEFHPVVDRLEDVRLWMLHVKEGESVAINCIFQLHKTLYDPTGGAFRDFMGLIRSTNPIAVVMAEQEADHNEPNFEMRVCNSLRYYSAIFDSVDLSLPFDSPSRVKIEEMYGREVRNIVAGEGSERLERHEGFGYWKRKMEQEGFKCMRTNERDIVQSKMLLKMYSNERFNVEERDGGEAITLSWLDQPLYTVSLWAPVAAASQSSSSFSQQV